MTRNIGILFFVKYPQAGKVKTRLSSVIGEIVTVDLYKNFILDLLMTLKKINAKVYICFYPKRSEDKFKKWLGNDYFYKEQKGNDLGERMKNAFITGFKEGIKKIIVIGSDSPDLPAELINKAFSSLEKNDAVIGPTFDGGYYLLGFKKESFQEEVFKGIKWSGNKVFKDTIAILKKNKLEFSILPKWRDIDTFKDLEKLYHNNKNPQFKISKTNSFISNYFGYKVIK